MSRAWIWLTALALATRLAAMVALDAHHSALETAHHEHQYIARSLAEGKGFSFPFFSEQPGPTSQQAPLVPFLLAGSYLIFGIASPSSLLACLLVQCVVGTLAALLLGKTVAAIRGERAGLWSALLAAMYPPAIIASLHIQALIWNLFFLALLLRQVVRWREDRSPASGGAFAVASAGALLCDPILGSVIAALWCLVAWEVLRAKGHYGFVGLAAVPALVLLLTSPWTVRNWLVHGRFVPIKDSFGYVFWQGNHPGSEGTDKLRLDSNIAEAVSNAWDPRTSVAAARQGRQQVVGVDSQLSESTLRELAALPNEIARMDYFAALAWRELRNEPWLYPRQCGRRLLAWLTFDPTNPRSYVFHYQLGYVLLLVLAARGAWRLERSAQWLPFALSAAALTFVHTAIITSARFRVPIEFLFLPLAGLTLETVLGRGAKWAAVAARHFDRNKEPVTGC